MYCRYIKYMWTKICARQCATSLFFPFIIFSETKCLEFQEIKGLAGSSGHETVCVSSWSTPLWYISFYWWSCVCLVVIMCVLSGKICLSERLKGVEWNCENPWINTRQRNYVCIQQCAIYHQQIHKIKILLCSLALSNQDSHIFWIG